MNQASNDRIRAIAFPGCVPCHSTSEYTLDIDVQTAELLINDKIFQPAIFPHILPFLNPEP